jgi:prepilin-type processing-associated H-X9-DG protein
VFFRKQLERHCRQAAKFAVCPSDTGITDYTYDTSYGINCFLGDSANAGTALTKIEATVNPTATMVFLDWGINRSFVPSALTDANLKADTANHGNSKNVLYVDGHVEANKGAEWDHMKSIVFKKLHQGKTCVKH